MYVHTVQGTVLYSDKSEAQPLPAGSNCLPHSTSGSRGPASGRVLLLGY